MSMRRTISCRRHTLDDYSRVASTSTSGLRVRRAQRLPPWSPRLDRRARALGAAGLRAAGGRAGAARSRRSLPGWPRRSAWPSVWPASGRRLPDAAARAGRATRRPARRRPAARAAARPRRWPPSTPSRPARAAAAAHLASQRAWRRRRSAAGRCAASRRVPGRARCPTLATRRASDGGAAAATCSSVSASGSASCGLRDRAAAADRRQRATGERMPRSTLPSAATQHPAAGHLRASATGRSSITRIVSACGKCGGDLDVLHRGVARHGAQQRGPGRTCEGGHVVRGAT